MAIVSWLFELSKVSWTWKRKLFRRLGHAESLRKNGNTTAKCWSEEAPQLCIIERLETESDLLRSHNWWCDKIFEYDPETKNQSTHWKSPRLSKPKKARQLELWSRSSIRGASFTASSCYRIRRAIYKKIMRRMVLSECEKRRQSWQTKLGLLYHDNAPAHNTLCIRGGVLVV